MKTSGRISRSLYFSLKRYVPVYIRGHGRKGVDSMDGGQALHGSPYVEQIEKFARSLRQLSRTFMGLEEKRQAFSAEEIEAIFLRVRERVCAKCEKCSWCWGENFVHTYQMGMMCFLRWTRYGNELNTDDKEEAHAEMHYGTRFLRETLEGFHGARQNIIWVNRMARSRESCAIQLDTFADMMQHTAKRTGGQHFHGRASGKKDSRSPEEKRCPCSLYAFFHERRREIRDPCDGSEHEKGKDPTERDRAYCI